MERYQSVEAMAEDVRAHLASRPISARAHTWTYRTNKFIRRNRLVVVATAAVTLALIGGLAMTLWQARIARQNSVGGPSGDSRMYAGWRIPLFLISTMRLRGYLVRRRCEGRLCAIRCSIWTGWHRRRATIRRCRKNWPTAYEKVGDVQGGRGR